MSELGTTCGKAASMASCESTRARTSNTTKQTLRSPKLVPSARSATLGLSVWPALSPVKNYHRHGRDPHVLRLPNGGDLLRVLVAQPQVQRRKELPHPLHLFGRVEHHDPEVQLPADQHRGLADAVPRRDLPQRALEVHALEPRERRQAHEALAHDPLGLQPPRELGRPLQVRMELDLVDGGLDLGRLEQVLDLVPAEVGETDRLDLSRALGGLEKLPDPGDVLFDILVVGDVGGVQDVSGNGSAEAHPGCLW